jgi:AcrR family transcriptional regulator
MRRMPKISDEHRAARQAQILDAAWRCFYREGVQATTMEQIMAESGLSASAMYRYFAGKDDIIVAAIGSSLGRLGQLLEPILESPQRSSVPALLQQVTSAIQSFSVRPGFHLSTLALHGWSEAQRNPRLHGLMRSFYAAFRDRLADRVRRWQAEGEAQASANAQDMAQTLLSLVLGFVVQSAVLRDADPAAHERGLSAIRAS